MCVPKSIREDNIKDQFTEDRDIAEQLQALGTEIKDNRYSEVSHLKSVAVLEPSQSQCTIYIHDNSAQCQDGGNTSNALLQEDQTGRDATNSENRALNKLSWR